MVSIVKSTTQPSDKEAVWIDLSTNPFKIKVFGPNGWTEVNDSSSTTIKIEELSRALAESISQERAERAAADKTNEDLAQEGISKAESASMMLFDEEAARKEADAALAERINAEATTRAEKDEELRNLVNVEVTARIRADAELQAKIQDHEDRIWKLENQWYGIEWDTEVSSPAVTRIGNMDLHRTLPIQSRMRGCLLDDNGKVTKYLNPKDWTGEVRDGSKGQVMVEIPKFYIRGYTTNEGKYRVMMSEFPLPGYHVSPLMYCGAYEATVQRSTGKLCSVVNHSEDFRGGDNSATVQSWDGTYRSMLGLPATNLSVDNSRASARRRNESATTEWNGYCYQVHKILWWLFVVEYATRNSQADFNAELTSEGYHQGGLGMGVTTWSYEGWEAYNGLKVLIPCGVTDSLGNGTGVVDYTVIGEDGTGKITFNVNRYRGIEIPFGHTYKTVDGVLLEMSADVVNGGTGKSEAWVCEDPALFDSASHDNYRLAGLIPRTNGFIKKILCGEHLDIIPSEIGGGSYAPIGDYLYLPDASKGVTHRALWVGGHAAIGANSGLAHAYAHYAPTNTSAYTSSRLCFIPNTK